MGHYELKAASSRFFSPSEPRPSKHPRRAPVPPPSSRNFGAPWKKIAQRRVPEWHGASKIYSLRHEDQTRLSLAPKPI
ncbi:hypothetical protein ALC53_08912 [Atta colombica]|uniref:Uncharacterized protein n=1 Tax=Atta colombica TaxID=520822 RepID=A0A195B884_9HYME|nr:hypothetical protein ALC53_08912 [Atta colombica]